MKETDRKKISEIVRAARDSTDIDKLLKHQAEAVSFLIYIQEQEAVARKAHIDAYNERKWKEAQYTIDSTSGVTKAQAEAVLKAKPYREAEAQAEYNHEFLRGWRNSINSLIDVLQQKVSHLKKEKEFNQFKK